MSTNGASVDLAAHIEPVARQLLGEPNRQLSNGRELRYGTHGSLSVDLEKATWFDHENTVGGGVIDLVRRQLRCDRRGALDWLKENAGLPSPEPTRGRAKPADRARGKREPTATYVYTDAEGRPVHRTLRYPPRRFVQERFENGRWIGGQGALKDVQRVLYRLPELLAANPAEPVLIAEGEKDCDRLRQEGFISTTNPEGAGSWRPHFADYLAGRHVYILPDNDEAGRRRVAKVGGMLAGKVASVHVLDLKVPKEGGDASDWFNQGHTADELRGLIAKAAEFQDQEPYGVEDDGLALELGREWGNTARHVALWGRWLFWNGSRWEPDERLLHMTKTREFLRRKEIGDARVVARVVSLARSNPAQASSHKEWDADPWVLNTPGGIVDLRTGTLRPPDPLAYCTKSTAVAPAPAGTPTPLWDAFLERIFRHDPDLIPFMQRVLGYALTGLTNEHALIFAWGQGANGKGTMFNTASRIMGDYAAVAPADMLLVTHSDRHPADMAMLRGARLVTAQELAPGRAWDEPKLKSLTGGDPITARFMRQDFFTYDPQFTLIVAGNHKPSFKGVDEAIRRRVNLVPFLQNIPAEERDKELPDKLMAEAPAILRWMIEGCLAWQKKGLNPPKSVREASEDYLSAEDVLGQWLEERCVVSRAIEGTGSSVLYSDWRQWCERGGLPAGSSKAFSQNLSERGFAREHSRNGKIFKGIGLRAEPGHDPEPGGDRDRRDGCDGSSLIDRIAGDAPCSRAHPHASTSYKEQPVTSVTSGTNGSEEYDGCSDEPDAGPEPLDKPASRWPVGLGPSMIRHLERQTRDTVPVNKQATVFFFSPLVGQRGGIKADKAKLVSLYDGPASAYSEDSRAIQLRIEKKERGSRTAYFELGSSWPCWLIAVEGHAAPDDFPTEPHAFNEWFAHWAKKVDAKIICDYREEAEADGGLDFMKPPAASADEPEGEVVW
jgi:putative DNA primase/helicase